MLKDGGDSAGLYGWLWKSRRRKNLKSVLSWALCLHHVVPSMVNKKDNLLQYPQF